MKFKLIITTFFIAYLNPIHANMKALNTAATGMAAQEMNVSTISNNIANINTTGFKKGRAEFEDLLYQTITEAGSRSSADTKYSVGTQIGSGSKISAVRKEFSQGSPQVTNNPFDLMLNGDGFFGILLSNGGLGYTRDGAFNVDSVGNFVNKQGYKVYPGIVFPPGTKSVNISEDGKVDVYLNGQIEPTTLATIPIFTFMNSVGLKAIGGNIYKITSSSGQALQGVGGQANAGAIQQGSLESSNVSIMNEMTNLIKAQRAYEMNSKVLSTVDQMLQTANNIR